MATENARAIAGTLGEDAFRNSLIDQTGDHPHDRRRIHDLTRRVEELERTIETLSDIVFGHLPVAVCDFCHRRWFEYETGQGLQPRGSKNGLLVNGGACCADPGCLDGLYETTATMEQDQGDRVFQDIALWLLRWRPGPACRFASDPEIRRLMRQLSP